MNAKTSLKAMAADPSDSQVKKTDLWKVDPRRLTEIDGFNLRDYDDPDEWPYGIGQDLVNDVLVFKQCVHGAQQLLVIDGLQARIRQADGLEPS